MAARKLRLSPSGKPVEGAGGSGSIVQQAVATCTITAGALTGEFQEIKSVMKDPEAPTDFRVTLSAVDPDNRINVFLDFDLQFKDTWITSTITNAIQVSVDDGAVWANLGVHVGTWWDQTDEYRGHVRQAIVNVDPADIAAYEAGDDILFRVNIEQGLSVATSIADVLSGSTNTAASPILMAQEVVA